MDDLRLLHLDIETSFVISGSERIERENDPDCSSGPRLIIAGCPQGNLVRVHRDLENESALRLLAIAAEEPPWRDPDVLPRCLGKITDLLSRSQPAVTIAPGVIYHLPSATAYEHPAPIVRGDSPAAGQMLARLAEHGLPQWMLDAGFKGVSDFWEPWCVALAGNEIASIAFAARLSPAGAEIGVNTGPNSRGQGFAAAVTANWSSLPSLKGRTLFYSTRRANRSSQGVAARLGLRLIGTTLRVW